MKKFLHKFFFFLFFFFSLPFGGQTASGCLNRLVRSARLLLILFFTGGGWVWAQSFTINGFIEDSRSGEKLIGANVYDKRTFKGTTTNSYGFFSLTLPKDSVEITISYVGYQMQSLPVYLDENMSINFEISPTVELKEVEITASQSEKIQENSQMSSIVIPMEQIKNLPVFFGEKDVLKIIQLLPGVKSGGEGSSGIYVRGGGPDQNLILLDGVPVYNVAHLFGFFSVFNPDAINSVQLIKGGFPARYGGRLSSVIDIRMKEGNSKKFQAEGSIGIVASKLTLEGPIYKDKTSFIVSGRRTYIDLLARPLIKAASRNMGAGGSLTAGYFFYDLNAKVNHKFSDNNRLFLSAYLGNDKFYFKNSNEYISDNVKYTNKENAGIKWGNITTALRWNYIINKKLFSNTTLTYSRYRFLTEFGSETIAEANAVTSSDKFNFEYFSGIYDVGGKVDFDFLPNPNHYIRFGIGNIYHTFTPGVNTFKSSSSNSSIDTTFGSDIIYANELYSYVEDDIKIGGRIKINPGLHFSEFLVKDTSYYSLQPRVAARYLLTENISLKAAYSQMTQYLHLLASSTIGLPMDLWLPVTDRVIPQNSIQYAAGLAYTLKSYEISLEGYYKTMENLIEYKEGASFFGSNTNWQDKIERGNGWGYGSELLVQKQMGKFSGWVGYTLSWAFREFENLNFGEPFYYRYDRRHDVSVALTYKFNEKIDAGMVWVYGTGNAITLPTERYLAIDDVNGEGFSGPHGGGGGGNDNTIENFAKRNDYRMAAYHRLDLSVNLRKEKKIKEKKWERTWSFGLYNAYSRRNPFYLYFSYDNQGKRVLKQVSLFPVIPFVSWGFKF